MGWAHGIIDGREVGYGVKATCDLAGCGTRINRGLAYRCGSHDFDAGCGGYFCEGHLYFTAGGHPGAFCLACSEDT